MICHYSILLKNSFSVNFSSSIELFFKARLLKEHWSLILKRPDKANISSFLEGEFQSVGINDTIKRLKNIAKESFSKDEVTCFEELRTHRNKLVHFFNPKYVEKLHLLTDATSDVTGFENFGEDFLKEMTVKGMKVTTTTEFLLK